MADSGTIFLGMSVGFFGSTQSIAMVLYRGSMAYFNYVNAQGGIKGQRIAIRARNDSYDPDPALASTIACTRNEYVLCLFDYAGISTVTRLVPHLKAFSQDQICLFFPFSRPQPQRKLPYMHYVYNLRASHHQETNHQGGDGVVFVTVRDGHVISVGDWSAFEQ
ncbi:ABC transporter substrate-binding protein [Desulfovibrio inopinatus]|uniref:ABC transporter substrate-binding protein n=1 Tax=Desulfovibrio inopinatus TaxID=102109 RepID=UPI00041B2C92|nr:ABC transporter substrate-binding protein [Desulfovibrio inopinatus]